MSRHFNFRYRIAKGAQPVNPGEIQVPVFADTIPFWGELESYSAAFFRDGERAWDIQTYSLGVTTEPDGRLALKFQTFDRSVKNIMDHEYSVDADFYFCDC